MIVNLIGFFCVLHERHTSYHIISATSVTLDTDTDLTPTLSRLSWTTPPVCLSLSLSLSLSLTIPYYKYFKNVLTCTQVFCSIYCLD